MVKKLNAGSLPRKLKDPPISVRSIGPSLGEANREAGLHAALYGGMAVTIFMIGYYFYAGGIAVIAEAVSAVRSYPKYRFTTAVVVPSLITTRYPTR